MSQNKEEKASKDRTEKTGGFEIVRLGVILFAITFVVALLLGVTNMYTKDRIAAAKEQTTADAMKLVQTTADTFTSVDAKTDNPIIGIVSEAKKGEEVIGWCVKVAPKGFGGPIDLMVGISKEKTVTGVSVISISETPGLGSNASNQPFLNQYATKAGPLKVVKGSASGENDILAISGATITSTAVTTGVQAALDCIAKLQDEGVLK